MSTLKSSGGDYTSIQTWWDTDCEDYDFVTNTAIVTLECYDDWPSGKDENVSLDEISGYSASTSYYPHLTSPVGERHNGTPQSGFYLKAAHNYIGIIQFTADYIHISYIDIENTGGSSSRGIQNVSGEYEVISQCIAKADIAGYDLVTGSYIACLAYDCTTTGFEFYGYYDALLQNCVAANCGSGFLSDSAGSVEARVQNCVAYGCTTSYGDDGNGYDATCTNNAASDGSSPNPPGSNPITTDIVSGDFNDAANDDFHLSGESSELYHAGADLSLDYDIDGDAWHATTPSVGFDEVIVSGVSDINLGSINITKAYLGSTEITKMYLGSIQVDV